MDTYTIRAITNYPPWKFRFSCGHKHSDIHKARKCLDKYKFATNIAIYDHNNKLIETPSHA